MFEESVKAMGHLNIGLTALEPMGVKYLKTGFPFHGFNIHSLIFRREFRPEQQQEPDQPKFVLKLVDGTMYDDVFKYQNSIVKLPRSEFDNVLLKASTHLTAAIKDGVVVGYGAIQVDPNGANWRISPLHADAPEISEALLGHLVSQIPDGYKAKIQVPDVNKVFVIKTLATKGFFEESDAIMMRLHNKRKVTLPLPKIMAIWNIDNSYP